MPRRNDYLEELKEAGRDLKKTALYGAAGLGAAVAVGHALQHRQNQYNQATEPTQINETVQEPVVRRLIDSTHRFDTQGQRR